jgi:hypothetical protein
MAKRSPDTLVDLIAMGFDVLSHGEVDDIFLDFPSKWAGWEII